ncbi:MAG TPA: hypothetical protein VGW57_13705 [Chthoniobacterales bacterium]|nr:hypothetical protein [Chthoniobacterales bacterium]
MNTYSNTKTAAPDSPVPAFKADLAEADVTRANTLSELQRIRVARANQTRREQLLLAEKLGQDHRDVAMLSAEVAAATQFTRQLGAEIDRVTIQSPAPEKDGWAVRGFVRNRDLEPQADMTVAFFDRANRWIEPFGHTCTDERGYFELSFSPRNGPAPTQSAEMFLRVSDRAQQQLYCDKRPMSWAPGETKYREIIIDGAGTNCAPPSGPSSTASDNSKSAAKVSTRKGKSPKKKKA